MERIGLIGTGGSIATFGRHALDLHGYGAHATPSELDRLLDTFRPLLGDFDIVPVSFRTIDSVAMDPTTWIALDRAIASALAADPSMRGIVVTHGTSTLEETAYFLHLASKASIPIVVVGSQRPPNALGSDAGINLLNAFRVAASPVARDLGVLVAMDGEIHCARDVTKTSNFALDAFRSPGIGPLGRIDPDGRVVVDRRPLRRHAPDTEFDVASVAELPSVEIVACYAGASAIAVDAFVAARVRGIVFAGTPPGRPSPAQRAALAEAVRHDVLVVQCSRASGAIVTRDDDHAQGFIGADTLTPQKARVLAMLALSRTRDRDSIARMFREY
ncbi:MAG TPA: asparaginase [Casimicrobiaceae bacterium]|nr:asparaginase [Casimicrobiaceae bacterium]